MTTYPPTFYVAHKLFTISTHTAPVWGDILDGPEDMRGMIEAVLDTFRDEEPTKDNLRVWFMDHGRYTDMTEAAITAYHGRMERIG